MIGIFGDQDLGDSGLGRQSAFDQPRRRGGLHHHVLTSPAAVFGTANYQHAELRRHDVETFADILADPVQELAAARASAVFDVDHRLNARQMREEASLDSHAALRTNCSAGGLGRVAFGLAARRNLLDLFQPEQHKIFGQRLGAATEPMTLQLLDDLT